MPGKIWYWDSCIIAYFLDGSYPNGKIKLGVHNMIAEAKAGRARILTSAIAAGEVLGISTDPTRGKRFFELFSTHSQYGWISIDPRVAEIAIYICSDYYLHKMQNNNKILSLGDAFHLAAAIHSKADAFYTNDYGKKDSRYLGLLGLQSPIASKFPLSIQVPSGEQGLFELVEHSEDQHDTTDNADDVTRSDSVTSDF
jgi:predicted nucleic acid-binding protein